METQAFFKSLDKEFIGLDRIVDETFYYKGADVLVQSTWELPIIIQWPGSTLKFEFSTAQGLYQLHLIATSVYHAFHFIMNSLFQQFETASVRVLIRFFS